MLIFVEPGNYKEAGQLTCLYDCPDFLTKTNCFGLPLGHCFIGFFFQARFAGRQSAGRYHSHIVDVGAAVDFLLCSRR
jgi:hypothetical protein